ncbi:MAG: hypothetical protein HEQ31_20350 [Dolichospermum sp. OL03]|nr:hypothetical protein [Dolichospermum sp. OL01]MCO5799012.1 hypothetical protein [Dolichospermum sp. OL03]MCS6281900.1 hypothetical protein [Dolichospermum sp.]
MDFQQISKVIAELLTTFGLKVVGEILLWLIGQKLIEFGVKLLKRGFRSQNIEPTLIGNW